MQSKYFTVEIKPPITSVAAGQHTAFSDGDVLFDWIPFQIPRGGGRLVGAHVEIRPKGDAGATPNKFPLELYLASLHANAGRGRNRQAPTTLGATNTAPANPGTIANQIDRFLGHVPIVAGDFADSIDPLAVASTSDTNGIVLQQDNAHINSGNVGEGTAGTNRFYMAGVAGGDIDFTSLTRINAGTLDGSVFTVNGTDPRLHIAVGDTIRATTAANTAVTKTLGTVKSMADANTITLEATTGQAIVNTDFIYNLNPIRILLTIER